MQISVLYSKIHRATVTDADLHYEGSITIDRDLMEAAGIVPYEQVLVANLANGTRHETYVVQGEPSSGEITVMGAAAHLVSTGDKVIIMAFADFTPEEAEQHWPQVVIVDENNRVAKVKS